MALLFGAASLLTLVGGVAGQAARGSQCNVSEGEERPCLCVFDIDRTLTGRQTDLEHCPNNKVLDMWDGGYGGGNVTLSAFAAAGINTTFCDECFLGITSAGVGSGEGSEWNEYLMNHVMRGQQQNAFLSKHPEVKRWSYGTDVHSPYVLAQPDRFKQYAVELMRQWYGEASRSICIESKDVFFFGDRTENIMPFAPLGLNSREISCAARDPDLYPGTGMVGLCGATPDEIQQTTGNSLCKAREALNKTSLRR